MNIFVKVCLRKSWFDSQEMAEQAAKRIRANREDPNNARMVAYRCVFCGRYHLGHLKKSRREKSRGNNANQAV